MVCGNIHNKKIINNINYTVITDANDFGKVYRVDASAFGNGYNLIHVNANTIMLDLI